MNSSARTRVLITIGSCFLIACVALLVVVAPVARTGQHHFHYGFAVAHADDAGGGCCGDSGGESGGGGGLSDGSSLPPDNPNSFDFCSISAAPSTITQGQGSLLSWVSFDMSVPATAYVWYAYGNVGSVSPDIGSVGSPGAAMVFPPQTTTYTYSGYNWETNFFGTFTFPFSCSTTITVLPPPPPPPPPSCTISAAPNPVAYNGSTTLTWTSANATAASIDQGIGSVALNGSTGVSGLTTSKTFTMTVSGPGGSATCNTGVTVNPPPPPPPPSCTISAAPNPVAYNGSTTLTWTSANATAASIDQGIGSVALNGSQGVGPLTVAKTYTMTVTGPGGSATCHTSVTVNPKPKPPTCTLKANPTLIYSGGSTTLTWTSTNATGASINQGIGAVPVNGSKLITNIIKTTSYALTVTGPGGTATCSCAATVTVKKKW